MGTVISMCYSKINVKSFDAQSLETSVKSPDSEAISTVCYNVRSIYGSSKTLDHTTLHSAVEVQIASLYTTHACTGGIFLREYII